jgi:diaminopimelate epimerase
MDVQTRPVIPFWKMTGSGNDFILVDNRSGFLDPDRSRDLVRKSCRHKLSVGADGFIFIENDPTVDFKWRFFNADGSEAEMCGNGARCAARFAFLRGIVQEPRISFRTRAGVIDAEILDERVRIRTTAPQDLQLDLTLNTDGESFHLHFVNTGVPHVVLLLNDLERLEEMDVKRWGRALRFHPHFQPAGTNVNFACIQDPGRLTLRTYERGVEDETLACGTGSIASALTAAAKDLVRSPVDVSTRGGDILTISFVQRGEDFQEVYLEGDAKVVYEGQLWDETLRE